MDRVMKLQQARARAKESGFTLVELAIVLVIIGLIVGGVLVGQDLIKAAELRATSSDIEKYNAAANTFRNRFNGLPGDLLADRADQFGMTPRTGGAGTGDGNALVEGCAQSSTALGCETALFWVDLTNAQLIGDAFTVGVGASDGIADGNSSAATITTVSDMSRFLPTLPLRESAFVHVYPQGGRNFFYLGALQTGAAGIAETVGQNATTYEIQGLAGLTPAEASQLDDKVDDGAPTTGVVRAVATIQDDAGATLDPGVDTAANGDGECVDQGATATIENDEIYNTADEDFANQLSCNIYWRSSF